MNSPFSTDKKYVDQHGVEYLYIGFHPARTSDPFVFTRQDGVGVFFSDEKGNILWSDNRTLHEVKPKITRWMNVYQNGTSQILWSGSLFEEKSEAETVSSTNKRIARIKVEFEEGEGL